MLFIKKAVKLIVGLTILVTLWKIGEMFIPPLFLPRLVDIYKSFKLMISSDLLIKSASSSFYRITVAAVIALISSLILSIATFNSNLVKSALKPTIGFMRFLPITAFYPLLIMWLGIDEKMKVTFLFFAIFFSLLPSYINIFESIESRYIDTALTMGSKRLELTFLIAFPLVFPMLLISFITSYAVGWTYVIIAENINTVYGLGHIMNIGSARGKTDMVFVGLFTIIIISFVFDTICNTIIKKMFKWHFAMIGGGKDA